VMFTMPNSRGEGMPLLLAPQQTPIGI
jgi:hypothetical protein